MKTRTPLAAALLVLAAGFATAAAAASITIHKQPRFAGEQVTLHDALPNLTSVGFQDQAASLVVNGTWELCSQPNYRGECVVLGPGRYETLDARLSQRVESARPLSEGDTTAQRGERASQATLYKQPNFTGGTMPLSEVSTNLAKQGFHNQASSAVITGGAWEFCSQPEFRGDCVVLAPGRYERLDPKIYHRMESARPVRERGRAAAAPAASTQATLYKQPNFTGGTMPLSEVSTNLAKQGFHNQASSAVITGGAWEFCSQPEFRGDCVVLPPGRYARLDQKIYHRMESARPVGEVLQPKDRQRTALAERDDRREAREERREERREGRRADRGAIDLYPGPDFRGRPLRLEHDIESLDGSRMNERVSSLIVHDGVWQACTRPGFEGRCRTFEPGQYPSIERMDDRIASLRLMR